MRSQNNRSYSSSWYRVRMWCVEADLCLAMQMWGLKLQARLESGEALAAKLVISRETHRRAHARKCAQTRHLVFILTGVSHIVMENHLSKVFDVKSKPRIHRVSVFQWQTAAHGEGCAAPDRHPPSRQRRSSTWASISPRYKNCLKKPIWALHWCVSLKGESFVPHPDTL